MNMSSSRAEVRWSSPSPALPADHVLKSGAVIFPGAFDQHGCPLVTFPAETQCKLSEEISGEEVSQFILYCLRLHNKKGEEGLLSVVADLRQADGTVVKFITETLLRLEFHRRIFHSVYFVQPKKKSVQKQLGKLLTQSSKQKRPVLFKRVFLKDVCELSNFIDRSQLTCSLGGYLMYCHDSWVHFIKEIDGFVQEFVCVVNRLPSCISTLQALAKLPVPSGFEQLRDFCSVNEARFLQLRRDLGLDDLLKRCERLLEKLRFPENEPCFHAMAGTSLFSHTALEMLQNYNRLSAAVEKVELLWQQAFSKPRLQLQVAHLQREAQQIQEQIVVFHREKVQPYRIQPAEDVHGAESVRLQFESLIYMHAMALVRRAEDVLHTLSESVQSTDVREPWVDDLHRMKESLRSSVQHLNQTLRNVSDFHYTLNRCKDWYKQVLCETFLSDLSRRREVLCESSFTPDGLMWRRGVETFLRRSCCPEVHELVKLAHLTDVMSDPYLKHTGKLLSHRCMTLRRLLTSPTSVPLHDLQLALQWQYEYLMSNQTTCDMSDQNKSGLRDDSFISNAVPHRPLLSQRESLFDLAKWPLVGDCDHQVSPSGAPGAGKPPSLSSFDSGFDGAGSSHVDTRNRREGLFKFPANGDTKPVYAQIHEENVTSVSDSEDQREDPECSLRRDAPQASIQIVPTITPDSVNLEIKVRRSATLPKNPWLSLPIDDLESSYTVTITPISSNQQRIIKSPGFSTNTHDAEQTSRTRDPRRCVCEKPPERADCFEDSELNPVINVLCSTITDPEENTVDAEASLLWDTFDLHNLRHDSYERLDASLCEWVQREQEELQEVEKTLERTAEIIQEEENVLAQEVMLDELLEAEDVIKHGPVWNKDQHGEVAPQDLVQSGVIGLDDEISSLPVSPRSQIPSSDADTETSEICEKRSGSSRSITESLACVNLRQKVDRSDVLQDLKVLEEQILEERLKLEALRLGESEPLALPHVTTRSSCRERRMFLAHLEDERLDVENMESLRRARVKKRVVRCSIMEKNSMTKDLWSSDTEEKLQHTDTSRLTEMNTNPTPQEEKPACTQVTNKSQSSLSSPSPDSSSQSEIDQDVRSCHEESDTSDLSRSSGTDSPASVHPDQSSNPPVDEISCCLAETQQTDPENCAFDPGGAPVPAPRRVFHDARTQMRSESISESIDLIRTPGQITRCLRGLHMHNNNNNNLVQSYRHDGHSETQQNISSVLRNTAEPQREESVKAEWESTGPMSGCERNEHGVYDGGGSTRAVFGSLPNTSYRPLDYKTPIVLDTGSGLMKAGFADQDLPTIVFPTVIGHPKYEEVMSGGVDTDVYVGHDAQHMRGVLTLKHPIRNGIVRNWDEMEMIWHHAFQQLSVDPRDHPVMLTEAARNPLENRQRMIELMFETFNVPLTFVAMQAVLALYASGRTTGVVLDSGDGVSHSVPVFDGYCLPHAVQRFNLAGADVTLQLQKLLLEQGVRMQTSAELEIVREMKEKCCCVALDYESEIRGRGTASSEVQYTLPDGRIVSLGTERFRAPEVLFKPELIGRDHYGMHESVFKSILQSDIDLRRSFLGNMVLSGGNTLLAGLPERLQMEIRHMVPADLMESVRVTSPSARDFSVWCGGAVLANLPVFSSAWISSDEYEEFGPQIVFRKCF